MRQRTLGHRTWWILIGITLVVIAIIALVARHSEPSHGTATAKTTVPTAPTSASDTWNLAAENALASRPMLALPPQDAQPQPLTTTTAGPPILLPRSHAGRWIAGGFPDTAVGAVGQLKALDETAMQGGDPDTYSRAYRELSLSGAPEPGSTGLASVLTSFRAAGGLPTTGSAPGLSVTYDISEGLIKGTADDDRYTVVCVLGELSVQDRGQTVDAGVGDCQGLRWTAGGWRVSPGAVAAPAPCAWPGSAPSVGAGYRELA
jgi:hypothetical protein